MLGRFGIFVYICRQIRNLKQNDYEEDLLTVPFDSPAVTGKCS